MQVRIKRTTSNRNNLRVDHTRDDAVLVSGIFGKSRVTHHKSDYSTMEVGEAQKRRRLATNPHGVSEREKEFLYSIIRRRVPAG